MKIKSIGNILFATCLSLSVSAQANVLNPDEKVHNVIEVGLSQSLAPADKFANFARLDDERSFHHELLFFEVVNSYGVQEKADNIFLMVSFYINANQQAYGIQFFEQALNVYGAQMADNVKANYLAAYAILRATYADEISLFSRIGWVNDTLDMLEEAQQLSVNSNPLVRWSAGLIYAQLPSIFKKREEAIKELEWLANNPQTEPMPGFYREVYHHLAKLYADDNPEKSHQMLVKSGYDEYQPDGLFIGATTTTKEKGLTFAPTPWIDEVVKGRVYSVYGFGFSDIHFVVSENKQELILIDAGTQPFSMDAAYSFLRQHYPELPSLTTVIITHAHWDHVGGHTFLRQLKPKVKFYGRANYHGVLHRVMRNHSYKQTRSRHFNDAWVKHYQPDVEIDKLSKINIGGSAIELIPVTGGETEDALLINFPSIETIFVGDVLMPYFGEPTVEEGFIDEALITMDEIIHRSPKHVLHGHYGLTFIYGAEEIKVFREAYAWLVQETRKHLSNGYSVKEIVRFNLIPPGLENYPNAFLGYLTPRNHIIARLSDHMMGIWQEDSTRQEPSGIDSITAVEYGRMLAYYLDLSERRVVKMLEKMLENGDFELALQMAVAAEGRYNSTKIKRLKERAADRNRNRGQFTDPFRLVIYTEMIEKEHKPIPE